MRRYFEGCCPLLPGVRNACTFDRHLMFHGTSMSESPAKRYEPHGQATAAGSEIQERIFHCQFNASGSYWRCSTKFRTAGLELP